MIVFMHDVMKIALSLTTLSDQFHSNDSKIDVLSWFMKKRKTNSCCFGLSLYGSLVGACSLPNFLVYETNVQLQVMESSKVKLVKF